MKYYLCLVFFVACKAARVPRISDQSYFPNFRNVYQGENYQNGQVESHARVPFFDNYKAHTGNVDLGNDYYGGLQSTISGQGNLINQLAGAPFENFKVQGNVPQDYERINHGLDYDYRL